jgi:hypothetical protein
MFIFEANAALNRRSMLFLYAVIVLGAFFFLLTAYACSCEWKGSFMTVAKEAPFVDG